jgi:diguanylate cyclase (GGDEF)-like protein
VPLFGPLSQAREVATSLGKLRHKQEYEIDEVIYEYVVLRQEVLAVVSSSDYLQTSPAPGALGYINRLLDEVLLATVECFYTTSVRDLEKRAIRDQTTLLYNREFFQQRLNEELRRAVRSAQPIAVVMLDLDRLKTINDSYGHGAGDEAIRMVANVIRDTARQSDVPCRYGGDEFAVILPDSTKPQALAFAERVMTAIQNLSLMVVTRAVPGAAGGRNAEAVFAPAPTVSIGVASFPEDARNPETLLVKADNALYRAKNEGRNRVSE